MFIVKRNRCKRFRLLFDSADLIRGSLAVTFNEGTPSQIVSGLSSFKYSHPYLQLTATFNKKTRIFAWTS